MSEVNRVEKAKQFFLSGYNCAQAVFGAFSDVTGFDHEQAMKISSSFGGGMGRMREVCGACSAIFMVAGILYGHDENIDNSVKAEHYALIQNLANTFKCANGTIICRELLSLSKDTISNMPDERTKEYYKSRPCLKYVEDATRILEDLIKEKRAETA